MAGTALFALGVVAAVFVGVNVGGSSTGAAFGPATGSDVLSMRQAAGFMGVFAMLGGVTVGRRVVATLGTEFVPGTAFTPAASMAILLVIGGGILLGNLLKVSTSTSQTAVVAVVGMGAAIGALDWAVVGIVVTWWLISTVVVFWVAAFVGRYLYDTVVAVLDLEDRGRAAKAVIVGIGSYMAFSAGASNAANAVAPLVGSGQLDMLPAVVLAGAAIAAGAFLLGPRTMETVGEDITDLTLEAALLVEAIAATTITALSWLGIPASLAMTLTAAVIGLGWGRASRNVPLGAVASPAELSDAQADRWVEDQLSLYDPRTVKRVVGTWVAGPTVAGVVAFVGFELLARLGVFAP